MSIETDLSLPNSGRKLTASQQVCGLIGFIALCFSAAGLGAAATATSVRGWYQTIVKPAWNPPDWLFGPVWSALYLLMGIAAWLVWRRSGWSGSRTALNWFSLQLILNVLWSVLFFGLRRPDWALIEILLLWAAILITWRAFKVRSTAAAWLFTPYLLWTTFAVTLNFALWRLNR